MLFTGNLNVRVYLGRSNLFPIHIFFWERNRLRTLGYDREISQVFKGKIQVWKSVCRSNDVETRLG